MVRSAIGKFRRPCALEILASLGLSIVTVVGSASVTPASAQFSLFGPSEASPQDIYDTIAGHGFRLVGPLYRNGRVYLADVLDRRQRRERLVIAAESGQIVQRFFVETPLGERRQPSLTARAVPRERDDSFFSHLTRGWDEEAPPRPPLGLNGPDPDVVVSPRVEPRPRVRQEPRVVTRTDVTPVTATPLAPPSTPASSPDKKPDAPNAAVPTTAPPSTTRATTVVVDPLRIPGNRKPDEPKAAPPATVASKPAEAAPASKSVVKPLLADVPVAPLD